MAAISFEHADEVRAVLRVIVADPAHGPGALSSPRVMASLLSDLLPDAPRETGILAVAVQKDVAGMLRDHVAQGLDAGVAVSLAASALATSTAFSPEACDWVAAELAIALGLATPSQRPGPGTPGSDPAYTPTARVAGQRPAAIGVAPEPPGLPDHADAWPSDARSAGDDAAGGGKAAAQMAGPGSPVPPMPVIPPLEQVAWPEGIVVAGLGPRIGWEFRRPAKGGPCFLVGLPASMGKWNVLERFPMTEDGWTRAWRFFASLDGAPVGQARTRLVARQAAGRAHGVPHDADAAQPEPAQALPAAGSPAAAASVVAELGRLASLLSSGLITREEFNRLKAQLLAGP